MRQYVKPFLENRTTHISFNLLVLLVILWLFGVVASSAEIDLTDSILIVREGVLPSAEMMAARVLQEEVERRTGVLWLKQTEWPSNNTVIVIATRDESTKCLRESPSLTSPDSPEQKPEGYRIFVENKSDSNSIVWIIGADPRGTLYGVGRLLRLLQCQPGKVSITESYDIASSPAYPIRGHQLGYRTQANSWDAWTVDQFDQYIRELAFFGINSIENIPFHDNRETPVMNLPRREMNRELSKICQRYGLDYWIWTPADFDLNDMALRSQALDKHEELFKDCPELTGVFFPGGDPGHNPPELVLPYLEDLSKRLLPIHPQARIWLSLQWFNRKQIDWIFNYLENESPQWLAGFVAGPSSPPIPETRQRIPAQYKFRLYPDITHNKLCQYPVPMWDQAYALTLGREAINPRPVQYAYIHNWFAPYSDGFISYSDGVHDDVNKTIWSARSWNPEANVRDILIEYARVFFDPGMAQEAADGILALEKNWQGPVATNGSIESTLLYWQQMEKKAPELSKNWRWQMCLVRAYYDAYIRHRLINETGLEEKANIILSKAEQRGADVVMTETLAVLNQAVSQPVSTELRQHIVNLCEQLFHSCGLQTSVDQYYASGAERGAFLDFIDYPMNNRWWLEDEFNKIRKFQSETEKCERLKLIANWEHPGSGSFYDDIGNTAKSPHVMRSEEFLTQPGEEAHPEPTFWWWNEGMSRARLSWQTTMEWPSAVVYEGLDPNASYTVRLTGYGQSLLKMDNERVNPTVNGKEMGEFKEFPVPPRFIKDRKLIITWDNPTDEGHLNWRQQSRLSEIWLLK